MSAGYSSPLSTHGTKSRAAIWPRLLRQAHRQPGICNGNARGPGACHAAIGVHIAQQRQHTDDPCCGPIGRNNNRMREALPEIDYPCPMFGPDRQMGDQIDDPAPVPRIQWPVPFRIATSAATGPVWTP